MRLHHPVFAWLETTRRRLDAARVRAIHTFGEAADWVLIAIGMALTVVIFGSVFYTAAFRIELLPIAIAAAVMFSYSLMPAPWMERAHRWFEHIANQYPRLSLLYRIISLFVVILAGSYEALGSPEWSSPVTFAINSGLAVAFVTGVALSQPTIAAPQASTSRRADLERLERLLGIVRLAACLIQLVIAVAWLRVPIAALSAPRQPTASGAAELAYLALGLLIFGVERAEYRVGIQAFVYSRAEQHLPTPLRRTAVHVTLERLDRLVSVIALVLGSYLKRYLIGSILITMVIGVRLWVAYRKTR